MPVTATHHSNLYSRNPKRSSLNYLSWRLMVATIASPSLQWRSRVFSRATLIQSVATYTRHMRQSKLRWKRIRFQSTHNRMTILSTLRSRLCALIIRRRVLRKQLFWRRQRLASLLLTGILRFRMKFRRWCPSVKCSTKSKATMLIGIFEQVFYFNFYVKLLV